MFYSFVEIKEHLEIKELDDFEQFKTFKMQLTKFQFSEEGKTRTLQSSLTSLKKDCSKVSICFYICYVSSSFYIRKQNTKTD